MILSAASIIDTGAGIMAAENGTIDIPLLITHGTADIMTCPKASATFFDKVVCVDKTYKSFPGAYHNCTLNIIVHPLPSHHL